MRLNPLLLTLTALMAAVVALPSVAMAAPPPNDDFDAASSISSMPFSDSLSTVEATTATDDPDCGGGTTVWYSFTPSSDVRVEANTFGSDYDTVISAYTGVRGSLSSVACNDDTAGAQSRIRFDAIGGTTYFIMASSWGESAGGNLSLTLQEAPPRPDISLSIDRIGSVDNHGVARIDGSISCSQPYGVNVSVFPLSQTFARRLLIYGYGDTFFECQPPSMRWSIVVSGTNGRFERGLADAVVYATACNSEDCTTRRKSAEVRLRGGG